MKKQLLATLKSAAILSLVVGLVLNTAWAAPKQKNTKTTDTTSSAASSAETDAPAANYYSASMVINMGGADAVNIVKQGKHKINMSTHGGAVDAYLDEQGIDSVEITCDLLEEWVDTGDGEGYYQLDFVFGPSGTYFTDPLELLLTGKYAASESDVWLYDENGERLEATVNVGSGATIFYIPHFSRYAYDSYDYY